MEFINRSLCDDITSAYQLCTISWVNILNAAITRSWDCKM